MFSPDSEMAEKKAQIRVYLPTDTDKILKILAAVKDSSVNALVNQAIEHWLEEAEQKEIVEKFNLDQLDEIG
jgi:predicted transcriptional regulator